MDGCNSGRIAPRYRMTVEGCAKLDMSLIAKYGWTFFPLIATINDDDEGEYLLIEYDNSFVDLRFIRAEEFEILTI